MPSSSSLLALAAAITAVNAAFQGFNYGSTYTDGRVKAQSDFEAEFRNAAGLEGTDGGFTSARLYTMIQGGTPNDPISAIPAAIKTKTSLLLGLWASAGDADFANEIAALKSTISLYCGKLDGLVAGISVGSEDLYRITPIGVKSNAGPGAQPDTLVGYIKQVRDTIKGSCLESVPIGHVDTWNAYIVDTNKPLIEACDWLGMDTYPYFEDTKPNSIENGKALYETALQTVQSVGGGKDVWITETGWPIGGKTSGQGVASMDNAQTYWQQVGCPNFGKVNIWWYTMQDAAPTTPNPTFGLIGSGLTEKPLFDLSCKNVKSTPSSSSATGKPTGDTASSSTHGSGSSSSSDSGSTSTSESGSEATTTANEASTATDASTLVTAPFPSSNGTATSFASDPSATTPNSGSGSVPTTGGPSATSIPGSSGSMLNSFGAAAIALILAAAAL